MMMIDEDTGMKPETPWHVWLVGTLAVIWNAGGAYDYIMTQTRNAAYTASFSDEQWAFFDTMPIWAEAAWAIAIWTSVIGSVLILLRSKYAAPVFLTSLIAMSISFFHNIVLSNALELMPAAGYVAFTVLIFVIAVGLYLYARWMSGWFERQSKMYID
ncbi:MAG: hypothetical protein AAFO57_10450 [Pseudomonadota bacterium]